MELRVLKYFLAVAQEENFTKAAQLLHITQPTLSRQIAQLEEELGVQLFIRSNHNLALTEDGMILKRRAQEMIALSEKTKQDFLHRDENMEGLISIGSGEFLSTKYLTDCIAQFRKKYPRVRYEIYSGNAGYVCDNIDKGLFDIGLITEPVDIKKYEFISMPVKEQWGVLVKADSPLAQKETVCPADLADIPLITPLTEFQLDNIAKWFGAYNGKIDITARGNLLYNEAMFAQSGIGAVLGIKHDCTYDGLKFIPLSPKLENTTALIWKRDSVFSSAASAFIAFSVQYLKGITNDNL